jgi:hypothetical protein
VKHRSRSRSCLWGFLILAVAPAAMAQTPNPPGAGDVQWSMAQRLDALESEVASLRAARSGSAPVECQAAPGAYGECQSGGLYAGYSFLFAKPHFKESFQATVIDGAGPMSMVPFSYDYDLTPRMWFGYAGDDGLGLRTRYWQYDHAADSFQSSPFTVASAQVVTVIFPASIVAFPPNDVLDVRDELEAHTVDLEGTQEITLGGFTLVASGGIRYAMMRQATEATVTDTGVIDKSLSWERRFEGVGPVVAVEVLRPVGGCGLAFIGSFRGALLYGNKNLDRVAVNAIDEGIPAVSMRDAKEVLGIGEIELGVQWARRLPNGTDLFVRGTYEGQLWSDSGTPTLGYLGFEGFGAQIGFAR